MEIDHLVRADVHGHDARRFVHLQAEGSIEREHGIGVLHGHRDMVESPHASWLLCRGALASGDGSRAHNGLHESTA